MIHTCPNNCRSDYQDARYGPGRRVFNPSNAPGSKKAGTGLTCTVCDHKIRNPNS